jgi:hypothetical protein
MQISFFIPKIGLEATRVKRMSVLVCVYAWIVKHEVNTSLCIITLYGHIIQPQASCIFDPVLYSLVILYRHIHFTPDIGTFTVSEGVIDA